MLKRKLEKQKANLECEESKRLALPGLGATSELFGQPLWQQFFNIEAKLNDSLDQMIHPLPPNVSCTYNPLVYASQLHCDYLRRYLGGPKKLIFVGMNPGPNGMCQTGIPFGNVRTVKVLMQLNEMVGKPSIEHPKRPVLGLDCPTEEPSGVRLWELFLQLAGNMETFSKQCFVHNFCPLAFFDEAGKNLTPSELKGPYRKEVGKYCLEALDEELFLLKPLVVVAVGNYVRDILKGSNYCKSVSVSVLLLPHPSPRSVNNTNWPEKAKAFLEEHKLLPFMKNEA
ncbi:hypothetical protein KR026_006110 [Drosophila bipectinata]|nr:hypothetical protein KR026_006110 [Drosophila bipectinata]